MTATISPTDMSLWSYTACRCWPISAGNCRRLTGGFTSGVSTLSVKPDDRSTRLARLRHPAPEHALEEAVDVSGSPESWPVGVGLLDVRHDVAHHQHVGSIRLFEVPFPNPRHRRIIGDDVSRSLAHDRKHGALGSVDHCDAQGSCPL